MLAFVEWFTLPIEDCAAPEPVPNGSPPIVEHDIGHGLLQLSRQYRRLSVGREEFAPLSSAVQQNLMAWSHELWPLTAVLPHQREVLSVRYVGDTRSMISADQGGHICRWDENRDSVDAAAWDDSPVLDHLWRPADSTLLTVDGKGNLRSRNGSNAVRHVQPRIDPGELASAEIYPDGSCVALGNRQGQAFVINTLTGDLIGPALAHEPNTVVRGVAWAGANQLFTITDSTITQWSLPSGARVASVMPDVPCAALAISPTMPMLATGGVDGRIDLWGYGDQIEHHAVLEGSHGVSALRFSPSGKWLAVGGLDGCVQVWSLETNRQVSPELWHAGEITCLRFDAHEVELASASEDTSVRVWRITGPSSLLNPEAVLKPERKLATSAASLHCHHPWARDQQGHRLGAFAASTAHRLVGHVLHGVEIDSSGAPPVWHDIESPIIDLDVSHRSESIAIVEQQGRGCLFFWTGEEPVRHFNLNLGPARAIHFLPNQRDLILSYLDGTLVRFDAIRCQSTPWRPWGSDALDVLAAAPRRGWIVGGSRSGVLECWEAEHGTLVRRDPIFDAAVTSIAVSADESHIAVGSADGKVAIFDPNRGSLVNSAQNHGSLVLGLCFSFDGSCVASVGISGPARCWNSRGRPVGRALGHEIVGAAFHPQRPLLATASHDQTLRLWEPLAGIPIGPVRRQIDDVVDLQFDESGLVLCALAADGTTNEMPVPAAESRSADDWDKSIEAMTGTRLDTQGQLQVLRFDEWQERK